jgi:hypothetical protein
VDSTLGQLAPGVQLGTKATDLLRLHDWVADSEFRVPYFALAANLRVEHDDTWDGRPSTFVSAVELPAPADLAYRHPTVDEADRADAALSIAEATRELGGAERVWLRSSVVLPGTGWSFAGVNSTIAPTHFTGGSRAGDRALDRFAGLTEKAYNVWYRSGRSLGRPSSFAVMVSQATGTTVDGHVTVVGERGCVDFGRPGAFATWRCVPTGLSDTGGFDRPVLTDRPSDERLRRAVELIRSHCESPYFEVEFGYDESGRLFLYQYRPLAACHDLASRPPGSHHSPTAVSGPLVSLLNVPRRRSALQTALGAADPDSIFVVYAESAAFVDAFALMWAQHAWCPVAPLRVVVQTSVPHLRSHLMTAAQEDPAVGAVYQLRPEQLAGLDGRTVRIDSDGVRSRIASV